MTRRRIPRSLLIASVLVLAVAVVSAWIHPLVPLLEIAAFVAGYAFARWWLVAVVWALAALLSVVHYDPCPADSSNCLNALAIVFYFFAAAGITFAVVAGIVARRYAAGTG